jgi:hypothetical protein
VGLQLGARMGFKGVFGLSLWDLWLVNVGRAFWRLLGCV